MLMEMILADSKYEDSRCAEAQTFHRIWDPLAEKLNAVPFGKKQDAAGWKAVYNRHRNNAINAQKTAISNGTQVKNPLNLAILENMQKKIKESTLQNIQANKPVKPKWEQKYEYDESEDVSSKKFSYNKVNSSYQNYESPLDIDDHDYLPDVKINHSDFDHRFQFSAQDFDDDNNNGSGEENVDPVFKKLSESRKIEYFGSSKRASDEFVGNQRKKIVAVTKEKNYSNSRNYVPPPTCQQQPPYVNKEHKETPTIVINDDDDEAKTKALIDIAASLKTITKQVTQNDKVRQTQNLELSEIAMSLKEISTSMSNLILLTINHSGLMKVEAKLVDGLVNLSLVEEDDKKDEKMKSVDV